MGRKRCEDTVNPVFTLSGKNGTDTKSSGHKEALGHKTWAGNGSKIPRIRYSHYLEKMALTQSKWDIKKKALGHKTWAKYGEKYRESGIQISWTKWQ